MIALAIPGSIEILVSDLLEVPETPEQAAERRRQLAAITEPTEVHALRARLTAHRERALAARKPLR